MIPAGSAIAFSVAGQVDTLWFAMNPGDLRSAIIDRLTAIGTVHALTIESTKELIPYFFDWPFTALVTFSSQHDHENADNVAALVRTAIYEASGSVPTVSIGHQGPAPFDEQTTSWLGLGAWSAAVIVGGIAVTALVIKRG